jgi:hypothetical protein
MKINLIGEVCTAVTDDINDDTEAIPGAPDRLLQSRYGTFKLKSLTGRSK